jgi:hypothetical protein
MAAVSEPLAKQKRCPHLTNAPGGQGLCVGAQCMMWRWAYDIRRISAPKAISNIGRDAYQKEIKAAHDDGFVAVQDSPLGMTLVRERDVGFCGLAGRITPDVREAHE